MIDKEEFLKKYRISAKDFEKTEISWQSLEKIYSDHESRRAALLVTGNMIAQRLQQIPEIHSIKVRVKDSEHLLEKIIRKKIKDTERIIDIDNYRHEITDLIGVRGLHLFKDDWVSIHNQIMTIWDTHEDPTANVRKGDTVDIFEENNCIVHEHDFGYRSVHYLLSSSPTKELSIVELQIRTIFEEGWSEIDHQIRYPYDTDNLILSGYLNIFNRFAGGADEMGTFIKSLKSRLELYKEEIFDRDEKLKELEDMKEKLKITNEQKEDLQKVIDSLKDSSLSTVVIDKWIIADKWNPLLKAISNSKPCNSCEVLFPLAGLDVDGLCVRCASKKA